MRALGQGFATALVLTTGLVVRQGPLRDRVVPPVPVGTAVVSGTVVNDLTNRPVRRATVSVGAADGSLHWAAVTDDAGTFAVAGLPAGRYLIGATRPGFVAVNYGAKQPNHPGAAIALSDGQTRSSVTLRLVPGAVLSGTVRTLSGDPLSRARVIVLHSSVAYDTGEPTLTPVGFAFGQLTDDRGVYRIFGLPPDEYYLAVTVNALSRNGPELRTTSPAEVAWAMRQLKGPGGLAPMPPPPVAQTVDYAPVLFPSGGSVATASTVRLKEGEERSGLDIVAQMIPTAKVSGTIVTAAGVGLPAGLQVSVIAHEPIAGVPFSGFSNGRVDRNGRFESAGLSPGDYTVTVRAAAGRGSSAGPAIFGMTTVTVNGADVETTITLETGATVSGRLVFDGTSLKPPPDLSKIKVSLTPVRSKLPTLGVGAVMPAADGTFLIAGVTPGRYRLSAQGVGGWQAARATVGGHDALDSPIEIGADDVSGAEITFTDRQTALSGRLLDAAGHPAPEYFIIVFPADRALWVPLSRRIVSLRPASDGHYRAQNLPPGDYLIAAVTDVEQGEWFDPAFLTQLVGAATKVTLTEGEKKTQDLRLSGG